VRVRVCIYIYINIYIYIYTKLWQIYKITLRKKVSYIARYTKLFAIYETFSRSGFLLSSLPRRLDDQRTRRHQLDFLPQGTLPVTKRSIVRDRRHFWGKGRVLAGEHHHPQVFLALPPGEADKEQFLTQAPHPLCLSLRLVHWLHGFFPFSVCLLWKAPALPQTGVF
jgi:hypothetical protein